MEIITVFSIFIISFFFTRFVWAVICSVKIFNKGRIYLSVKMHFLVWISRNLSNPIFFMAKLIIEDVEKYKIYSKSPKIFFDYYAKSSQEEMDMIIKELESIKSFRDLDKSIYGSSNFVDILFHGLIYGNFEDIFNQELYFYLDNEIKKIIKFKLEIKKQKKVILKNG